MPAQAEWQQGSGDIGFGGYSVYHVLATGISKV